MSDDLRAELLTWADVLARGTGSVPAVDVAWKLRQLAGAMPTTGPAPGAAATSVLVGGASCTPDRHVLPSPTPLSGRHPCPCGGLVWDINPERPAVPQAPAQPTEPMASCGVHTEAEAQNSIRHELCTPAAREDTARPTPSDLQVAPTLGASGDTAPPAPVVHDITVQTKDNYASAHCSNCGLIAGDFDSEWVQDRVDSHRADNLIPARPSAPPVDGDTDA